MPPPAPAPARIEVSNGNGVPLIATRVAQGLMSHGIRVAQISDARTKNNAKTRIHVRDSYIEQAHVISGLLGIRPEIVRTDNLPEHLDLRVVLGRDIGNAATIARTAERLALSAR
jgi:hypothetical protein